MAEIRKRPTKTWIKKEARFRAGLILESVMANDWAGDTQNVDKYGQELADSIAEEISAIAAKMVEG